MVYCIHGNTANGWSNIQPPAASGLAELSEVVIRVADATDSRTGVLLEFPYLAALQPQDNLEACGTITLSNNGRESSCTAAKYSTTCHSRTNVVHLCANRDQTQRQAVASETCLRSQNTRIDDTSHALQQRLGDS
jgi:hypothetical protein